MSLMHLALNKNLSAEEFQQLSKQMIATREDLFQQLMQHCESIPVRVRQSMGKSASEIEVMAQTVDMQQQYMAICLPLLYMSL